MLGWAKEGELAKDTIQFLFPLHLGLLLPFTCRSYTILSSTRSLSVPGFQREETAQRDVSRRKCEGVGGQDSYPFFKLKIQGLLRTHFPFSNDSIQCKKEP